jgi:hypothetical protein
MQDGSMIGETPHRVQIVAFGETQAGQMQFNMQRVYHATTMAAADFGCMLEVLLMVVLQMRPLPSIMYGSMFVDMRLIIVSTFLLGCCMDVFGQAQNAQSSSDTSVRQSQHHFIRQQIIKGDTSDISGSATGVPLMSEDTSVLESDSAYYAKQPSHATERNEVPERAIPPR